jgi:predicted MFS family arabinose efflux permease
MTTGPVFLRMVVRAFDRSRGIALAIAISTPPIVAILASPLLSALVAARGWRFGALTVAAYAIVAGFTALALIPRGLASAAPPQEKPAGTRNNLRELLANRNYRILLLTTVLVSMPMAMTNSQLALVLIDNGMTRASAGSFISLFAFGTVAGRLLAGLALDRFRAEAVGAVAFSLPGVGMLLLASPFDQPAVLGLSIMILGLAFGGEGDILAYLLSRMFGLDNYGTALGTMFAAVGVATMLGAFVLSQSLRLGDGYTGFLIFGSISVVLGSALFLTLRRRAERDVVATSDRLSEEAMTA